MGDASRPERLALEGRVLSAPIGKAAIVDLLLEHQRRPRGGVGPASEVFLAATSAFRLERNGSTIRRRTVPSAGMLLSLVLVAALAVIGLAWSYVGGTLLASLRRRRGVRRFT
jgi:hypothetical protein